MKALAARDRKRPQRTARDSKGQQTLEPAGAQNPLAQLLALRSLLRPFFFPLRFKFCSIVLRVANARALIINLRRLYHLLLLECNYNC